MLEKTVIEKKKGFNCINIELEYDKKRYDIELAGTKEIILRRLSDKKIMKIFDDNIGFIVQIDKEGETHFIVSRYSKKKHKCILKHYIEDADSLSIEQKLDCQSTHLEELRLSNSSFLVGNRTDGYCMYNLEKKSGKFDLVYNDDRIKQYFDDNTILVSRKVHSESSYEIMDTIMYGVNPKTFEIVTPIWSNLQKRSIPIYTEEQIDEIAKREIKKGKVVNRRNYNAGEITIHFEIEEHLKAIGMYFDEPERVYKDFMDYEVNEDFIRRLTKKN